MKIKALLPCPVLLLLALAHSAIADTYVIPFADIRQQMDVSNEDPDDVIRAYLAGVIRDQLDAEGFNVDGGLVFSDVPVDAITETITTNCNFPQPYQVHIDATSASVSLDDSSSFTIALDSIRSIDIAANLTGLIETDSTAWVRWGQDVIFVGDCKTINTDHGWIGLSLPLVIDLNLGLTLDLAYDSEQLGIVVDKYALLAGQAQFNGGSLQHEFGSFSPTDLVLDVFENELLSELNAKGQEAVADAIAAVNFRLDGRDEDGVVDPTLQAFNGPTTFVLEADEEDQAFIRDLLDELGIPDLVLAMVGDRGVEILLQLAILEGPERDAYLAGLGAELSCTALLNNYQTDLERTPIFASNDQVCDVADVSDHSAAHFFSDAACANEIAFRPGNDFEYCLAQFGDSAKSTLGNAASWPADADQPGDKLPSVPSRAWTTLPSTQLDLGVVGLTGNNQPYVKQLNYKTVPEVERGNGVCELEIRVYKRDIEEENLKPLVALHGGSWQHRGSSFTGLEAGVSHFTDRGFIVFAPFYRLVGETDGNAECNGASWREVTEDVESALAWVRQNGAALGAADEPVNVFGQSAGAHLAAWLAANRSDDVGKALLYYGPMDAMEFLSGAVPPGGPYVDYQDFGLKTLGRFFGARSDQDRLFLEQIDFSNLTVTSLEDDWATLIPSGVFDLRQIDPTDPPIYLSRCIKLTGVELGAIDLSAPPIALINCMKQDLSEFLVDNSFNHQLADEAVPVFVLHGSGDSLVPHAQAVNLCAAIDGNSLPVDVVNPLTAYACGNSSEVQIIAGAEHSLDLGICLPPLCPAGEPGSETRTAAASAIEASHYWLAQDLIADADGDGVSDELDAFPFDPAESVDTDGDGIGNNADPDDDNDGVIDSLDDYPLGRFTDVPSAYWAFSFIEKVARAGIVAGCTPTTFCPASRVTRADMAVFLELGIRGRNFVPPAASGDLFIDVASNDYAADFIEQLAADRITAGCGGGKFCPAASITRDQMAVFLLRAKYGASYSPPPASGRFTDVPLTNWAVRWIEQLAAEGVTSGCGGGKYCPNSFVTMDQMAVFLVRTFELE